MPTKSAHKKIISSKPAKRAPVVAAEETEEVAPIVALKSKAVIEIDEVDPVIAIEEKPVDDLLVPEEEADELESEEAVLDEEIDPFNDKYEA